MSLAKDSDVDTIEALKQAVKMNPDDAEAHYKLGTTYGNLGMYKEANDAYKQTIRINPDSAEAYSGIGAVFITSSMYKEAIDAFNQAIRINPDFAEAHYNLACSYSLLGSINKALESLGKAIDAGFDDIKHLENDSDLDGLRDEAGYKMLINKLRR
jgi:tetratricopeptide (TPR) repeat protein